jgi:hypothetical protein
LVKSVSRLSLDRFGFLFRPDVANNTWKHLLSAEVLPSTTTLMTFLIAAIVIIF